MNDSRLKSILDLGRGILNAWTADECPRLAAALSFFLILSLSPMIIILTSVVGAVLGQESVQAYVIEQLTIFAGEDIANTLATFFASITLSSGNLIASIIAFGTLIYSATIFLGHLHRTMNIIWKVPQSSGQASVLAIIRQRVPAVLMVIVGIAFFFFAFIVGNILSGLRTQMVSLFPRLDEVTQYFDVSIVPSLLLVFALFYLILKYVPDAPVNWRIAVLGAAFTTILFGIGQQVLQIYLLQVSTASIYGAAGSIIVVLLWIYYTMQIFLLGAEFTHVLAIRSTASIVAASAVLDKRPEG